MDAMSLPTTNYPTLTLRSRRMGDCVRISVVDTGHGIPPGVEDAIFASYYTN